MRDFNEVYKNINEKFGSTLEIERKKAGNKIIIMVAGLLIIGLIVSTIFHNPLFFILDFIICAVLLTILSNDKNYKNKFNSQVLPAFIKECDENLEFDFQGKINYEEYKIAGFEEQVPEFFSENLTTGILDNKYQIEMSNIKVKSLTKSNKDGSFNENFSGLFAKIKLDKEMKETVEVRKSTYVEHHTKRKILIDSNSFNVLYDVYSNDKVYTMKILTHDFMNMLIEFDGKNNILPEFIINGEYLYIRFHTRFAFEPNLSRKIVDYKMLHKYYDTIYFINEMANKILSNVE